MHDHDEYMVEIMVHVRQRLDWVRQVYLSACGGSSHELLRLVGDELHAITEIALGE